MLRWLTFSPQSVHINELIMHINVVVPRGRLDTPCLPRLGGASQRRCTDVLTYCHDDNFCLCQPNAYRRAGACGNHNTVINIVQIRPTISFNAK